MTALASTVQKYADCPQCGGCGDTGVDEEGKLYVCYFCFATGRVLAAVAAAYAQDVDDMAQRFAPRRLGIFIRPMAHEYDYDDTDGEEAPGHRLFSRLIPAQRQAFAAIFQGPSEDIPF